MYFDNGSTSWPKHPYVLSQINRYLTDEEYLIKREGNADGVVWETRKMLSEMLNVQYPSQIIFTSGATEALNLAIYGVLREGDHVITTVTEHNSVIRPLVDLVEKKKITVSWVESNSMGIVDTNSIEREINSKTKMIIINHVSNVLGCVQPVEQIGELCIKNKLFFLLDASQSIGHIDVDCKEINCNLVAFPAHKGLGGVTGLGALYIDKDIDIKPIQRGGTGVLSELLEQPSVAPYKFESGTPNYLGIYGLHAALEVRKQDKNNNKNSSIWAKVDYLRTKIKTYEDIEMYGDNNHSGILSFNIKNLQPSRVEHFLQEYYGIIVRSGLHCAPLIHKFINSSPYGTVRISISEKNTYEEINFLIEALKNIVIIAKESQKINLP